MLSILASLFLEGRSGLKYWERLLSTGEKEDYTRE